MDESYIENLADFSKVLNTALKDKVSVEQYVTLFKSIAPSRYQFTETVLEVRADLQMASTTEIGVSGMAGIKAGMFAVMVNASYSKRSAYDYQAAALIRTVLHAVPADAGVMDTLLKNAKQSTAALPDTSRFKVLSELITSLPAPATDTKSAENPPEQSK
jgi:hypothetical protein